MKTNLHIRNFGKINSANIQLRPLTVIVGPNSSGKSLITKSLYSIFYSLSKNLIIPRSMEKPSLDSGSISQLQSDIKREFLDNLQLWNFEQLCSDGNNCSFNFSDLGSIEFKAGSPEFKAQNISSLNKCDIGDVVYLESPACFKLNQVLNNIQQSSFPICGEVFFNRMPKYFNDLEKLIESNATTNNSEFMPIVELIESKINGSFNAVNGNVTFTEHAQQGTGIPLSMVSDGILNLGLISLLIKQNILSKGSVLIVDAPESNLHPEWQHFMLDVLVELSKLGVMVITATHSLDMLYRFEYLVSKEKELALNEHFSLNRLTQNGTSISSDTLVKDIRRAKEDLGRPYVELMKERLPV